ncbi:MAG: aminotransferase class IV [Paludibacter sp.]|nr:aminotransferase class IV [Paludibacter sp.]
MSRFLESIQLKAGEFKRLPFHQARVDYVMKTYFPNQSGINLTEILSKSSFPNVGLYKCRIVFDAEIQLLEFSAYKMRNIKSLKLVETDLESMPFKSEDREKLNEAFSKRENCDDVILIKNGLLTDTSYANIGLYDGENWITPRTPLVYGVNRAELIEKKKIIEKDIRVSDLKDYSKIRLFNAMIEFGALELGVEDITC